MLPLPIAPLHVNWRPARRPGQYRVFELAYPWAQGDAERFEAILSHVDVRLLFDRVRETWDVVIDETAANAEGCFIMQNVVW